MSKDNGTLPNGTNGAKDKTRRSGTTQTQSDVAGGTLISIGTPLLIGAALRAVRRDAPASIIDDHLRGLRALGADDDLSVALVVQWLEERQSFTEPRNRTARANLLEAGTDALADTHDGGDV